MEHFVKRAAVPLEAIGRARQREVGQHDPQRGAEQPAAGQCPQRRRDPRPDQLEDRRCDLAAQVDPGNAAQRKLAPQPDRSCRFEAGDDSVGRDQCDQQRHLRIGIDRQGRHPTLELCPAHAGRKGQGCDRDEDATPDLHDPGDVQEHRVVATPVLDGSGTQADVGKHPQARHDHIAHRHHSVELGREQAREDQVAAESNDLPEPMADHGPARSPQEALFQTTIGQESAPRLVELRTRARGPGGVLHVQGTSAPSGTTVRVYRASGPCRIASCLFTTKR